MTITEEPGSAACSGNASNASSPGRRRRTSLLKFQPQSVISKLHIIRQFGLRPVVIIIMGEVSETGAARANPSGGGEGFIQAHVGRMRRVAQRVKNCDFHTAASFDRGRRNELAIVEIGQP